MIQQIPKGHPAKTVLIVEDSDDGLFMLRTLLQLKGYQLGPAAGQAIIAMLLLAAVMLLRIGLYVLIFIVIVQAVVSWVNPGLRSLRVYTIGNELKT